MLVEPMAIVGLLDFDNRSERRPFVATSRSLFSGAMMIECSLLPNAKALNDDEVGFDKQDGLGGGTIRSSFLRQSVPKVAPLDSGFPPSLLVPIPTAGTVTCSHAC